ncbi:hypothetical protein LCGC14_2646210, partial [marine sediment metagenome]
HAIQWMELGWLGFGLRYAGPRGRWTLEVQAERAALRELALRGAGEHYLRLRCKKEAAEISDRCGTYRMRLLDRKRAYEKAHELYLEAAGLAA